MKKAKITILALAVVLCLSGCTGNIPTSQGGENSSPTFSQQISNPESQGSTPDSTIVYNEFRILEEPISDLGLTVEQLTEKRGELKVSTYKGTQFENGIGIYGWKTTKSDSLTDGGCNIIGGLKPTDLFSGLTYPITLDILSNRYGFVPITIEKEKGLYDCYWSLFTHPYYENVAFQFAGKEYGFIEEDTSCILNLNVDSTDAKPIIQYTSSGNQPETSDTSNTSTPTTRTPLTFTKEDKELQTILGELVPNASEVLGWFNSLNIFAEGEIHKFKITNGSSPDTAISYCLIPDNYTEGSLIVPTTYSQLESAIKKYFTNDAARRLIIDCGIGFERKPGEITVTNTASNYPIFLEVEGKLYRALADGAKSLNIDYKTAKVTEKTDNHIEFTYLNELYYFEEIQENTEYKYEELYHEYAKKGLIIREDGEWKLLSPGL